ncbi:long-chain fatty acid--CoA ligase [Rhodospirillaceae bacterium KN72]|uniref:Long-chain fatty acid--CoA ligase n=1 Tax=Pacificispira spongiicola TaxID=2729598 RepID=A0A7Y0HF41_9PROT|nr:AMP-binding protein [Pacificispira spongiicola]NMM43582.1 long-chain fatty acid--CoA ligase [Pacificispira spongiicola]
MHKLFTRFQECTESAPDHVAVRRLEGLSFTYAELAAAVEFIRNRIPDAAKVVGLAGLPSASWIAADLAATLRGCRVVPIPFFFSPDQQTHILSDASVDIVVVCDFPAPSIALQHPPILLNDEVLHAAAATHAKEPDLIYPGGGERVIYTSGTTGAPKGVRHGDRQIDFSLGALESAAAASPDDKHLSLLPPSLLLEQIAGYFLPLSLGAEIVLASQACLAALGGDIRPTATALSETRPTTTVLVPQQVTGLVQFAKMTGWQPPDSLRLVAVGGAPIAGETLTMARRLGLPVRFGYGLSECCSVVSVQRGGSDLAPSTDTIPTTDTIRTTDTIPTTGQPLPGTRVELDDGEIVVRSPGVMIGYLGSAPLEDAVWRTGDLGRIGADGSITVLGRKDRRITLSNGRNLSPEWLESLALSVAWVGSARADGIGNDAPHLTVGIRPWASESVAAMPPETVAGIFTALFAPLPDYARPDRVTVANGDSRIEIALNRPAPHMETLAQ